MAKSKNVIEINGKTYDAVSGHPTSAVLKPKKKQKRGMVVDGFMRKKKAPTKATVQASAQLSAAHPAMKRGSIHASAVHKVTKKSVTLSRKALKKPTPTPKAHAKSIQLGASSPETNTVTETTLGFSKHRLNRAQNVKKSADISKFGTATTQTKPQPTAQRAQTPMRPTLRPSAKEDLIAQAMASLSTTDANQKPAQKNKRSLIRDITSRAGTRSSRLNKVMMGMVALLAIGYGVYANIPNIALRVAASRAGFEANMPGYSPAGFSFAGPIAYSPGQITIEYASTSDGRAFTVTERETNWDSQSLLDNHIAQNNKLYQTFQERGLTIYVYEGNRASWVNGGIWYTIEGDSLLNTEQLIKIASSL